MAKRDYEDEIAGLICMVHNTTDVPRKLYVLNKRLGLAFTEHVPDGGKVLAHISRDELRNGLTAKRWYVLAGKCRRAESEGLL